MFPGGHRRGAGRPAGGLEQGNQPGGKRSLRDHPPRQRADCAALLLADPAFEKADFQALARWVAEHPVRYASVQILTPIPPTPFYRRKEGELTSRDLRQWDLTHLVLPPEHMSRRAFLARYRLLLARLTLCTWRRGAFRFVTPAYLGRVLVRWWRRRGALR